MEAAQDLAAASAKTSKIPPENFTLNACFTTLVPTKL
jgi:hypothetical protein